MIKDFKTCIECANRHNDFLCNECIEADFLLNFIEESEALEEEIQLRVDEAK